MVAAGLVMSASLANNKLGAIEQEHVDVFWESIDEILNAVLFVLIGLVLFSVVFQGLSVGALVRKLGIE